MQHDPTQEEKNRRDERTRLLPSHSLTKVLPGMTISANVSDKPQMATRGVLAFLPQKPKLVAAADCGSVAWDMREGQHINAAG